MLMSASARKKRVKDISGKKGVVEVQFNWIFILIAGALILVFFIMIVNKQKSVSDKKLSVEILNSMDRIMSGQKTAQNRQDVIDMYEIRLSYLCGGCDCEFSLEGMSKSKGNLIVFAPSSMKSDRLLTWTQSWSMPFRATNMIYMSIPEIKYYFIEPPDRIERDFISNMPANVTYEVVKDDDEHEIKDMDDIEYGGEQMIRLVFFENPSMPEGLRNVEDSLVTALYIDGTGGNWQNGKAMLKFYKKDGSSFAPDKGEWDSNDYPVLGAESAYGAVYTDSFQAFKCNMIDAVRRLEMVSRVYEKRSEKLSNAVIDTPLAYCSVYYATNYFDGFNVAPASQEAGQLYSSINTLATFNEGAVIQSCPRIY